MPHGSILIVDDNPDNLKLMLAILSPLGFELRTASDGSDALTMLETFEPSLLLLDLQLPGLDGLSVARRIKADPDRWRIPIVAVTAYAMKGDEKKARDAGCDGYLTKPVDKRALRTLVTGLLTREPVAVQRG
jgi:two-component system, cell cycle response regulator DivK